LKLSRNNTMGYNSSNLALTGGGNMLNGPPPVLNPLQRPGGKKLGPI